MTWLWVVLGAAVGAPGRYLVDRVVQRRHESGFPWGTFVVNLIACVVLGVVTGLVALHHPPGGFQALLGVGLCGTLSTYSTFSFETMRLAERGAWFPAVANAVVSVLAGLGGIGVGMALAAL